jgi:hypothetical protein
MPPLQRRHGIGDKMTGQWRRHRTVRQPTRCLGGSVTMGNFGPAVVAAAAGG